MIEFYTLFLYLDISVDNYSSKYKRRVSQLDYNSIVIPGDQVAKKFINGLGADFTTIQNTIPLSSERQSVDIDTLTTTARNHLALFLGNRDVSKLQRDNIHLPSAISASPNETTPRTLHPSSLPTASPYR